MGSDNRPREPAALQVVIPRAAKVVMATELRSTVLCSSLQGLRAHGLRGAYDGHLAAWAKPIVDALIPGSWTPMAVAQAHYLACDALGLTHEQVDAMYREAASRIQGSILSTLATLAKRAGVSPWTPIEHYERMLGRMLVGGSVAAFRVGPKEALLELRGNPLFDIPYSRQGLRILHEVAYGMFASRVYVREVAGRTPGGATYRISWV